METKRPVGKFPISLLESCQEAFLQESETRKDLEQVWDNYRIKESLEEVLQKFLEAFELKADDTTPADDWDDSSAGEFYFEKEWNDEAGEVSFYIEGRGSSRASEISRATYYNPADYETSFSIDEATLTIFDEEKEDHIGEWDVTSLLDNLKMRRK